MNPFDSILTQIRRESVGRVGDTPDEELLTRFVLTRNEPAFEELLSRYGPMVMGIARRTTVDRAAAEDVFQATFLALVGRAGTIRRREAVGTWLSRVAFQTGKRLQRDHVRLRHREQKSAQPEAVAPAVESEGLGGLLDEELNRLPEKYRQALVLCCVLEKSFAEAGQELGISAPAVWKRVRKGQDILRKRLDARGVAVASAALSAMLVEGGQAQAESASAIPLMIRSAASVLSGATDVVPARVVALAKAEAGGGGRIVRNGLLIFATLVSVGAIGYASLSPQAKPSAAPKAPPVTQPHTLEQGTIAEMTGVVRGPDGQPLPRARVTVLAKEYVRGEAGGTDRVIATVTADAGGHYRVLIPEFATPVVEVRKVKVLTARWDNATLGSAEVNLPLGAIGVSQDLTVAGGRTVRGRVLDRTGLPVSGARVSVTRIGGTSIDPVVGAVDELPSGWPAATVTDATGSFQIPEIDAASDVKLAVEPRNHSFAVVAVPPEKTDTVVIPVGPARRVEGRVTAAGSGEAIPFAKLIVTGQMRTEGMVGRKVRADAHGAYSVLMPEGDRFVIQAHAPDGVARLAVSARVTFATGDRVRAVDLALPAGVTVRGEVREADGTPVGGTVVQYIDRDGPLALPGVLTGGAAFYTTKPDGTFTAIVPAGHGTLLVFGPTLEYQPVTVDNGELGSGTPDGWPVYPHAAVPLTVDPEAPSSPVRVTLNRGIGIDLNVVGPDGTPVASGMLSCRHLTWPFEFRTTTSVNVRNGTARLPGCIPGRRYTVVVSDGEQKCGAIQELVCPANAAEPVTIRLRPVGEVTGRVVRTDGRSPQGMPYKLTLQLPRDVADEPAAIAGRLADPTAATLTPAGVRTVNAAIDAEGRVRFNGLMPGGRYRFGVPKGTGWTWIEFGIAAGAAAELPAIVVE